MLDAVSQVAIFVFGLLSILLIARKNKWGFIAALLAEPFWFITSYTNGQWGVFWVSVLYLITYLYGAYRWFREDRKKGKDYNQRM